jgi:hypothetical protein
MFSHTFAGEELGDGAPGVRQFAFAIPLPPGAAARLSRLTVQGAGEFIERAATDGFAAAAAAGADLSVGLLTGAAGALTPASSARVVSTQLVGADLVRLTWDASRYPLVAVRNPATGSLLAVVRTGEATLSSSARELDLLISDGVKSFVERAVLR